MGKRLNFGFKVANKNVSNASLNAKGGDLSTTSDHSNFKNEVLNAHNNCRKKHNTPFLTWSRELENNAQKWADELAKEGKFKHAGPNQRKGQGENISFAQGQLLTGEKATMMWYNEMKDFNFSSKPAYNPQCGHFTQVVWAGTNEIGAGLASTKDGKHFLVARYSPAGNMLNDFETNVKPPVGKGGYPCECDDVKDDEKIQPVTQHATYCQAEESAPSDENGNEAEVTKQCTDAKVRIVPDFYTGITYTVNKIEKDSDQIKPQRCETVEVIQLKTPVLQSKYHSRNEYDLKRNVKYHVIHFMY